MDKKLALFKVACLNYTANPVVYQEKSIARRELISLQRVVSDLAKHSIESTQDHAASALSSKIQVSPEQLLGHEEKSTTRQADESSEIPVKMITSHLSVTGVERAQSLLTDLQFKDRDL